MVEAWQPEGWVMPDHSWGPNIWLRPALKKGQVARKIYDKRAPARGQFTHAESLGFVVVFTEMILIPLKDYERLAAPRIPIAT
jgi:hypothetical protein